MKLSQIRDEYLDREAIRDCLYRYSRGVDRCDAETLRSAYWEDAVDDHGMFVGKRDEFVDWVVPFLATMACTQHSLANILIRIDGDVAHAETYYNAYHRLHDGERPIELVCAGRYIDVFEKRDEEWRLAKRNVLVDWFREYADACDMVAGPLGNSVMKHGERFPTDDSYCLIKMT